MTADEQQEHTRRLERMASGKHEGPLSPEDVAALKWAYAVSTAARPAARKIWTMMVRQEVEPRYELEELVALFHDEHPFTARMRLREEERDAKGGGGR